MMQGHIPNREVVFEVEHVSLITWDKNADLHKLISYSQKISVRGSIYIKKKGDSPKQRL